MTIAADTITVIATTTIHIIIRLTTPTISMVMIAGVATSTRPKASQIRG